MLRPPLEVADIFRLHGKGYASSHSGQICTIQYRAMRAIERCRTSALGGHVEECNCCGHRAISYNSCRNRNCPKCQSSAAKLWLEQREAEILPVPYFHVVFTVPKEIACVAAGNQKLVYEILFRSVSRTLLQVSSNHFGGRIGFLAILHTWGQNLEFHPHIHCVVAGGALSSDGRWIEANKKFFLPVAVLSKVFRGKFLALLRATFRAGKLHFSGRLAHLDCYSSFVAFLKPTMASSWIVYCKPPFGSPQQVLAYLGRYTHRIAISNNRLVTLQNGIVTFRWKDYRDGSRSKLMSLTAEEFIRRFLMHVLPARFVRIRHYGFLSNRKRTASLTILRRLLSATADQPEKSSQPANLASMDERTICPVCNQGRMVCIEILLPMEFDSS